MSLEKLYIKGSFCEFSDSPSEAGLPKFRIVANTGAAMEFWDERVAIDVDGVFPHTEPLPVFGEHFDGNGIGHSTKIYVNDGKLVVEGVVSRETESARDFVSGAKNGFPWQASVGGYIRDRIELQEGETLDLHGETIQGPATVATKFEMYEVSVVALGADKNTSSTITAKMGGPTPMKGNTMGLEAKEPIIDDSVAPVDNGRDEELQASREKAAAEIERVAAIKARSLGDDEELQAKAIREGWTADKFELEALRALRGSAPAVHTPSTDCDEKALVIATLRAMGVQPDERRYEDAQLTAADRLGSLDFLELAERASRATPFSFRKDSYSKVCAAISTTPLGSTLSNAANAALVQTMNASDTSWRKVFKISSVYDYKATERWKIDTNFEFKEVPPGGDLEHATAADEKYTIQAKLWGRQFVLPEQSIVNGDALGVFGELIRQIGFGANDAINRQAWGLLMNPASAADGKAFYHADHASLKVSCAFSFDNLSAARAAFINRKRAKATGDDAPLGIPPQLLVVPPSLEDKALMVARATTLNNGAEGNTPADFNPHVGRFTVVGVPFLEYATYTNYSATTWYLFADPNRLPAFEIAFLNGNQAPIVRQDQMKIGTLGIEFDAHFGFGVAQEDYRGALKCISASS